MDDDILTAHTDSFARGKLSAEKTHQILPIIAPEVCRNCFMMGQAEFGLKNFLRRLPDNERKDFLVTFCHQILSDVRKEGGPEGPPVSSDERRRPN